MRLRTSAILSTSATSSRIRFTTAGGVPRGTNRPNHDTA
jgi:hypothetical protein